jgi:NB-ARC domain
MTSPNVADLDFDKNIEPLISEGLLWSGFDPLTKDEVYFLRGSWLGKSYEEMAAEDPDNYNVGHLQRNVAPAILERLSKVFKVNVRKNTLHKVIGALPVSVPQSSEPSSLVMKRRIIGTIPSCEGLIHRDKEFTDLIRLLEANRVVAVVGAAGMGKTALISQLFKQTEWLPVFQPLVWKYSISGKFQEDILDLQYLIQSQKDSTIFDFIRSRRLLICIDRVDDWFKSDSNEQETQSFLRKLIEIEHSSCIVFTMREPIALFDSLQRSGRLVQTYELQGLSIEESRLLLSKYSLKSEKLDELISNCRGNPQHLHESAQCIERLYGGDIGLFLEGKTSLVLNTIKKNLSFICSRVQEISDKERGILSYIISQSQGQPVLENDIIESLCKQFGYSLPHIIKILNILKSSNLVVAEDSSDSTIAVPSFVAKYVQLNPEQFPSLALPA